MLKLIYSVHVFKLLTADAKYVLFWLDIFVIYARELSGLKDGVPIHNIKKLVTFKCIEGAYKLQRAFGYMYECR